MDSIPEGAVPVGVATEVALPTPEHIAAGVVTPTVAEATFTGTDAELTHPEVVVAMTV